MSRAMTRVMLRYARCVALIHRVWIPRYASLTGGQGHGPGLHCMDSTRGPSVTRGASPSIGSVRVWPRGAKPPWAGAAASRGIWGPRPGGVAGLGTHSRPRGRPPARAGDDRGAVEPAPGGPGRPLPSPVHRVTRETSRGSPACGPTCRIGSCRSWTRCGSAGGPSSNPSTTRSSTSRRGSIPAIGVPPTS